MVRLVLFDIDGTLIHSGGAGVKAFGRAFASAFDLTRGTERLVFAGRTDTALAREFFFQNQVEPTPANFRRFFDSYVFWLDHLLGQLNGHTCPGVWEFIRAVESLPQPPVLGLLTGNIRLGAEIKLRHFALWNFFQTGAFGDDHEERDQLAVIARTRGGKLLGRDLRDKEILVIGDTPMDVACANAIEARCLAVATGSHKLSELQKLKPAWAVKDLRQVRAREVCG